MNEDMAEFRNPKAEIRKNPKLEMANLEFRVRASFEPRNSGFGIRASEFGQSASICGCSPNSRG